jgi:hypothetical protein
MDSAPRDFESLEIFPALLGCHQGDLGKNMGRRGLRRHERQLQMGNNPIDRLIIRYE